ncbi:MAG TPA: TIGR02147 family protein [Fibrobacteria bacterium]|nr:TIGR02147 family protein [Fibrobacteria bacterium]
MPDIFNYTDFRKYLSDLYRELKAKDPKYSHRYMSMKMGYGSAGFFADVIAGRKNLTGALPLKLSRFLGLKKDDEEYFINLVLFNQAATMDEKNRYYEKLMGVTRIEVKILEAEKFRYFSQWFYTAVRELLSFHSFRGDFRALGKKLDPPITPVQARQAVEFLLEIGLLRLDADGAYRPTDALISTGEGFASLNVANFQRAFLDLAREGLDRHPSEERDYSTLSLPLAKDDLPRARLAIAKLRSYLMALSEKSKAPDRVYHFNFQAFPLTGD